MFVDFFSVWIRQKSANVSQMHKYDFTCIFVVKLFAFVKPITFLCEIRIHVYRVIYAYLQIVPYFCGYDFAQHK